MIKKLKVILLCSLTLFGYACTEQSESNKAKEKTAPFSKIDFIEDKIYVTIEEKAYEWLKLDLSLIHI